LLIFIYIVGWSNGIDEAFTIYVLTGEDPKGMQSAGVSFSADGSKGYKDWPVSSSSSSSLAYRVVVISFFFQLGSFFSFRRYLCFPIQIQLRRKTVMKYS
jgi:hypothetical protein